MTTSITGARTLLAAAGLALAGSALTAAGVVAQQQPPSGEILRPGPMLQGGAIGGLGSGLSTGQDETETMQDDGGTAEPDGPTEQAATGPADAAYQAAMERMHQDMAIASTGDPDVDFARAMIPHHQGAVEMAKAVLAYGKDAEIRKLAEAVIGAQEREIAQLNDWLAKRPR